MRRIIAPCALFFAFLRYCAATAAATTDPRTCATGVDERTLLGWIRSSHFLQMEFFTMAGGRTLAFAELLRDHVDERHYRAARSLSALWLRLDTMERVNETIEYATREAAGQFRRLDDYGAVMKSVFDKIEAKLRAEDATLYERYARDKERLPTPANETTAGGGRASGEYAPPPYLWNSVDSVANLTAKAWIRWLEQPATKKFGVNGDFLYYGRTPTTPSTVAEPEERERFAWARSVLAMSKNVSRLPALQSVYEAAVEETANALEFGQNFGLNESKVTLFEIMREKFKNHTELRSELEDEVKKHLSADA